MKVRDIMTSDPVTCDVGATLEEIAFAMVTFDCGLIPIVEGERTVGTVTDRDIACRTVANGRNPLELTAREVMSTPPIFIDPDAALEQCAHLLEKHQIRRILVRDRDGRCCGIVAQADLARDAPGKLTAEVVREVSAPVTHPAHI